MAYREHWVRTTGAIIATIMLMQIPADVWFNGTQEQRDLMVRVLAEKFQEDNPFCRSAKIWLHYQQHQIEVWIRCIDGEKRC